jgi:phenylalanyl-tRNA synthetase beta chain
VLEKVREVMTAAGYDEAMTLSVVDKAWSQAFSPWTQAAALATVTPVLRGSDQLRRSLVPSLLGALATNESLANTGVELFEIAHVYLLRDGNGLPDEQLMLALASGGDYFAVKGVVEAIVAALDPLAEIEVQPTRQELLDAERASELRIVREGRSAAVLGYLGEVADAALAQLELRQRATVAELKLSVLVDAANLVPQYVKPPIYPAVTRDLNLVVDESVRWAELAPTVRRAAAPAAEHAALVDVYRDAERLGPGKKSFLITLALRSQEGTLTSEEADRIRDRVVTACRDAHGAQLRA